MTITLHWWLIPILVLAAALIAGWLGDDGNPYNFIPLLIVIAGVVCALSITVGHYL